MPQTPVAKDYFAPATKGSDTRRVISNSADTSVQSVLPEVPDEPAVAPIRTGDPQPPVDLQLAQSSQHSKPVVALDQFVRGLCQSGLMGHDEVEAFIKSLPDKLKPAHGKQLAQELFRQKRLTAFQVQAVYQGKTRGLVVGNYVVLDKLGEGGMGEVYKARHRRMDRIVAIKILPAAATKSPDSVRRFQREVKVAGKLHHENVVTAYDADEYQGVHFLVMEYVEGKDLSSLVRKTGPLPVGKAVDLITQAARGLEYAHDQGIIHRDVKPHNLLLDKQGTIKLLDLGLARLEQELASADGDDRLTRDGAVMGTIDYMPPEQSVSTKSVDGRADIYSLGCTLHFLLTGKAPFGGETLLAKLVAHRKESVPSLRAIRSDVPATLDAVFQRMMAKHPDDRQPSMGALLDELEKATWDIDVSHELSVIDESTSAVPSEPSPIHAPLDQSVYLTQRLLIPHVEWRERMQQWAAEHKTITYLCACTGVVTLLAALLFVEARSSTHETTYKTPSVTQADLHPGASEAVGQQVINETDKSTEEPTKLKPTPKPDKKQDPEKPDDESESHVNPAETSTESKPELRPEEEKDAGKLVDESASKGKPAETPASSDFLSTDAAKPAENPNVAALLALSAEIRSHAGNGKDALKARDRQVFYVAICFQRHWDPANTDIIEKFDQLLHLNFWETPVTENDLKKIAGLKKLEFLNIGGGNKIPVVTFRGLTPLQSMTSIKELHLQSMRRNATSLEPLAYLQSLEGLSLWRSEVSDADLVHLTGLKKLSMLEVGETQIGDAAADHISSLQSLRRLYMDKTRITDAALPKLANLKQLQELRIRQTSVTAEAVANLRKMLPNCRITTK